jgi:hypothetical protein
VGRSSTIRHGTQPVVVWIISKGYGRGDNSDVCVTDTAYCVVSVVAVLSHLKLFIYFLSQTAGGILVAIGDLRTICILFTFDTTLHVVPPCCRAAHRIGQGSEVPAPAPLKQAHSIERVNLFGYLSYTIVFIGGVPIRVESGKRKSPSVPVLRRLSKALGVPVGELLE